MVMVARDRARLIVGSLGLGVALWGFVLFLAQMYGALDTGRFEGVPVRLLLDAPAVRHTVPRAWLQWLTDPFEMGGYVDWFLDEIPLPLFLIVVGGVTVWRSALWEPSGSRDR